MNRRFLIGAGAAAAVGGLAILALFLCGRSSSDTRLTEEEIFAARRRISGTGESVAPEPAPVPPDRRIRLAIGSLGGMDAELEGQVADLLTARLTEAQGLELVDRPSLDLALRETHLTLASAVRAKDAIRIGQLVRADWFLLGTRAEVAGRRSLIARVVDSRTGIMRDAGVFPEESGTVRLAENLAGFIRQSRQFASQTKPHVYLALGSFEDLSLNNRLAALPGQLRAFLTAAYQGTNVTVLERECIMDLVQEQELDLAGLTENRAAPPSSGMQSAFWIVGGFYQAHENNGLEVELMAEVTRLFGRRTTATFRGPPGEPLFRKLQQTIDDAISKHPALPVPTRAVEARNQLATGKDLLGLAMGARMQLAWSMYDWDMTEQEAARRRRHLQEAIRSFQTVMLLEATNRQAKVCLAACLRDPTIGKVEQACDYYRQVLDEPVEDEWSRIARMALKDAVRYQSADERRRWFETAAAQSPYQPSAAFFREQAEVAAATVPRATGVLDAAASQAAEAALFKELREWDQQMHSRMRVLSADAMGLGHYVERFGTNRAAAAGRLVELLPRLQQASPDFAPHLLAGVVSYQVDTNAPIIREFERSFDESFEHPEKVFDFPAYCVVLCNDVTSWCARQRLPALAAKLLERRAALAAQGQAEPLDDRDRIALVYYHLACAEWPRAMEISLSFSNRPVQMGGKGPWGQAFQEVHPSLLVNYCREKMSLPPIVDPREFRMSKSCLTMHAPSTFATVADGLWVAVNDRLLHLDYNLATNLDVGLPLDGSASVTCLCIGSSNVWVGTSGAGLMVFDKQTRHWHRLAETEGLLMDHVSGLHLTNDKLWIGFGRVSSEGGVGCLDLASQGVRSFIPALLSARSVSLADDPLDGPPRHRVQDLTTSAEGDLWLLASHKGIQRFHPASSVWETLPSRAGIRVETIVMGRECLVQGLAIAQVEVRLSSPPGSAAPPLTNQIPKIPLTMSQEELTRFTAQLRTNPIGPRVTATLQSSPKGAVGVYDFRSGQWRSLSDPWGIPHVPTAMTVNGDDVWLGGEGYLAVVDLKKNQVRKLAYISAGSVDRIQIGGGFLWALINGHLHRASLSETL